ncbi:hypothetical protein [Streptomyces sp. NPDC052107]|jgi:hypothetical protein
MPAPFTSIRTSFYVSRLFGEHFAGTRYAAYFAAPSADAERD